MSIHKYVIRVTKCGQQRHSAKYDAYLVGREWHDVIPYQQPNSHISKNCRNNIVNHDAKTAADFSVKNPYRPWLPHVINAENKEGGDDPFIINNWDRHESNPHPDKFIPNNAAVVMNFHIIGSAQTN